MKHFLTPSTGKVVDYPDHFAALKPYLVEVAPGMAGGSQGGVEILDPEGSQGIIETRNTIPIIGGVVLVDPATDITYSAGTTGVGNGGAWTVGTVGGAYLIDPGTEEPYRFN